jgi:hypothetical protein
MPDTEKKEGGLWLPEGAKPEGDPAPIDEPEEVDGTLVDAADPGLAAARVTGEALIPTSGGGASTALIDAANPQEMIERATAIANALSAVIEKQGLRVNMGTSANPRWHVEVEGWQTLGTLLGTVPIIDYARPWTNPETGKPARVRYTARVEHFKGKGNDRRLERITTYDVDGYSWEAKVRIVRNGVTVGIGEGLCSRNEVRWGTAEEYAVKSMAITRATSRALKQAAGWIVALAGYEATPAAEVDPHTGQPLPYGPAATGQPMAGVKRAAAYLMDDELADEETFQAVEDWLTAISGLTNGYVPEVVARSVIRLAHGVREYRAKAVAAADGDAAVDGSATEDPPPTPTE